MPPACSVCTIVPFYSLNFLALFGALDLVIFGDVVPFPCLGHNSTFMPPVDYCTFPSSALPLVLLTAVPFGAPVLCCSVVAINIGTEGTKGTLGVLKSLVIPIVDRSHYRGFPITNHKTQHWTRLSHTYKPLVRMFKQSSTK